MMTKRECEEYVLFEFLKNKKLKGCFAKGVQNMLQGMQLNKVWNDKPDFLFEDDESIVGIEHFLVDVLSDGQVAYSRKRTYNQSVVFNRYKDDANVAENINAANDIFDEVLKDFNKGNNIDYNNFIEQFKRIKNGHSPCDYHKNMQSISENKKLGFLIELTYFDPRSWLITTQNNNRVIQAINGVPITVDMLEILKLFHMTDFVILSMNNVSTKKIDFYVFDPNNTQHCLQEQGIIPCKRFAAKCDGLVLERQNTKKNGSEYTATFTRKER